MIPPELPSEDPTELEQLVVDDSDGEGEEHAALTKTSSALNVVRTKLIRHISHDNESTRRSRASAGHSQEEVARRAELRRFRHQRIQEELKNEGSNAESSNTSHRSTRYLSPLIDAGQPRVGPRDTIEFVVTEGHHPTTTQAAPVQDLASGETQPKEICDEAKEDGGVKQSSSAPPAPTTKSEDQAFPLRPPSTHSATSQKLTGCSYNVPRLDRVLGTDNEFDIRHGAHAWEEQSALGIWLVAQGLRSRSSSIRRGDSETNDGTIKKASPSPHEDFSGIDSTADALLPTHYQVTAKKKLHELRDSSGSAPLVASLSNDHGKGDNQMPPICRNVLLGPCALNIGTTRPVDNSSSNYPSVLPSFQPSPNRSQSNFHHLSAEDLESLELSPFSCQFFPVSFLFLSPLVYGPILISTITGQGNFSVIQSIQVSEGQSSYATAEDDIFHSDHNASSAQINFPPMQASIEAMSLARPESAGTHQGEEAKAQTIGMSFGGALSHKKPSLNFGSRFKEEFHSSSVASGRRSFISKMNLSIARRSKRGSNNFDTAKNKPYSVGIGPSALGREGSNGIRLKTPPDRSSLFDQEEDCFPSAGLSPGTTRVRDYQKPLMERRLAAFETSRLTPHSDELLPDETQSSSRRILQQWTTNIQGALSPNSTVRFAQSCRSKTPLVKTPLVPPHHATYSYEVRATSADPYQPQLDGSRNSISDILLLESGSRFRPGKLGKAVRSGLKKLIPSHDNERQLQLLRRDENENYLQSRIMRTDTLSIESDRLKAAANDTDDSIVPFYQRLSVDSSSGQPSTLVLKNTAEPKGTTNDVEIDVRLNVQRPLEDSRLIHRMGNGLVIDDFSRPWSRRKMEQGKEAELEEIDSTSLIIDARALRRWKSTLDVSKSRKLSSIWTERPVMQSLSLNNLRV